MTYSNLQAAFLTTIAFIAVIAAFLFITVIAYQIMFPKGGRFSWLCLLPFYNNNEGFLFRLFWNTKVFWLIVIIFTLTRSFNVALVNTGSEALFQDVCLNAFGISAIVICMMGVLKLMRVHIRIIIRR